jgi:transposase
MLPSNARVFVATEPVDFRGAFGKLAGLVREHLGADPRSGDLFVFLNRGGDRLKMLFFDQTGDCLLYKRLDERTFRGIVSLDAKSRKVEIDGRGLVLLLAGTEKSRGAAH